MPGYPPTPPGYQPYPLPGTQSYAPPQYFYRPQVQVNGMCIASLVLGIVGLVCFVLYAIPSVLAIVFAVVGQGQVDRSAGAQSGKGLAVAGLILGIVGVSIVVLLLAVVAGSWNITRLG